MSSYDDKKILPKQILDEDLILAWDTICNKLGEEGNDFHTISRHPKKKLGERWFHASSKDKRILIEKAKNPKNFSKVDFKYWIYKSEFDLLAELYNEYARGDNCNIRYSTDSHMSPYIVTLIAELL
jgi:hypothetical protein